nr:Crp/Fnr family transcriptional regulator [Synechococcus elongatus PCC 11802]
MRENIMSPVLTRPTLASGQLRQILEQVYRDRPMQHFTAGQTVPLPQDSIWVVCRGIALITTSYESGDEALLGLAGPSMPFGSPLSWVMPYEIQALTDLDLIRLKLAEIEQTPLLAQDLFLMLAQRYRQTEMLLSLIGQRRVEDRLRNFLQLLGREFGQPEGQLLRLNCRLTHQHLANALGTTRVTVTRLIGQFRREGWLDFDEQRHLVLKAAA